MQQRALGPFQVSSIGLGCMSLSHGYGAPLDPADAAKVLHRALDIGYTLLDTAALYGFGRNETLLGGSVMDRRSEFTLATKCGLDTGPDGKRELDGRPERIRRTVEQSLQRLKTDVADLLYLHRLDPNVPIEDSVGEMSRLVEEGKARTLGLSEMSADTVRRAHAVHPITALQTEYSLWTRNAEVAALETCRELGITFVAFSPVGRGFLAGSINSPDDLVQGDLRKVMPRFQGENFAHNLKVRAQLKAEADAIGCTLAQACLAWLLHRSPDIVPIPGTTRIDHLEENAAADTVVLSDEAAARLDAVVNTRTIAGGRYAAGTQTEINTEKLPEEA